MCCMLCVFSMVWIFKLKKKVLVCGEKNFFIEVSEVWSTFQILLA